MNRQVHTLSTRPVTETHAHYKVTRTFVGADGKKRTETVEMLDDDAIKVSSSLSAHRSSSNPLFAFDNSRCAVSNDVPISHTMAIASSFVRCPTQAMMLIPHRELHHRERLNVPRLPKTIVNSSTKRCKYTTSCEESMASKRCV